MIDRVALRSAWRGFAICALLLAIVGFGSVLGAFPYAERVASADPLGHWSREEDRSFIVENFHFQASSLATLLLPPFAFYWLLSGLFGKGEVLPIRWANILLAIAAAIAVGLTLNGAFAWIDTHCDQMPFPHEGFEITKVYECPSSQTFAWLSTVTMYLLVLGSLITRISASRRTWS